MIERRRVRERKREREKERESERVGERRVREREREGEREGERRRERGREREIGGNKKGILFFLSIFPDIEHESLYIKQPRYSQIA